VALERGDASGEASLQLTKIGEDDQRQAIQVLIGELGLPLPKRPGVVEGTVRKAMAAALTEYGIAEPKGTTAVLVALARLKWLRSRPRFDVF
jgi:hypothetical protein